MKIRITMGFATIIGIMVAFNVAGRFSDLQDALGSVLGG